MQHVPLMMRQGPWYRGCELLSAQSIKIRTAHDLLTATQNGRLKGTFSPDWYIEATSETFEPMRIRETRAANMPLVDLEMAGTYRHSHEATIQAMLRTHEAFVVHGR